MNTPKIVSALTLVILFVISGFVSDVSAQEKIGCRARADQIYYVDSGRSVTEVRPGSNGGNGYQLNILGSNVDKFQIVKEPYMTSVSVIPGYTNASSAKWQIFFAPKMGRVISTVRMSAPECTGRLIKEHQLTEAVKLLDQ